MLIHISLFMGGVAVGFWVGLVLGTWSRAYEPSYTAMPSLADVAGREAILWVDVNCVSPEVVESLMDGTWPTGKPVPTIGANALGVLYR